MTDKYEAHCRRPGCQCSHDYCYRGWRDTDKETRPCEICRTDTHRRWVDYLKAIQSDYPLEARQAKLRGINGQQ